MPLVLCVNCNKPFEKSPLEIKRTKNNFCSQSCSASFNNKGTQRNPPKLRICKICGKKYYFTRKTKSKIKCDACFKTYEEMTDTYKSRTLAEYHKKPSVKNKHPSWKNSHIRALNRSWNKSLLKKPCQICGYSMHIELCHIKPVTSFPETATLGEVNHPDNNLVLCPNHHWEYDNKKIRIEDIPKRI
jgi:hypothetical protein